MVRKAQKEAPAKQPAKPAAAKAAKPRAKAVAKKADSAALTARQEAFVLEYIKDRNGAQAAKRAGYAAGSCSVHASRLLANARIRARIDEIILKVAERAELTVERTLREVARIAYFDPRKLLNEDGTPKQLHELDDDTAAGIAGLEVLEEFDNIGGARTLIGHVKKYKLADKNAALEKAMKHLGLYEKDNGQKPVAEVGVRVVLVPPKQKAETAVVPMKREG